jgi:hypothetical protein
MLMSCGGRDEPTREGRPFTAEMISQRFHEVTATSLKTGRVLDLESFDGGRSISLTPEPIAQERYGDFAFIVEIGPAADPGLSLTGRRIGEPDANDIYWTKQYPEHQGESASWTASKYRGNVRLDWYTPVKETDARWRTVATVLATIPSVTGN